MKTVRLLVVVSIAIGARAQGPVFTTLYEFKGGADGTLSGGNGQPNGVTVGKNGKLYGATFAGGANSCGSNRCGTVYELSPTAGAAWTKTVLHDFSGADGAQPDATLVFGSNGALYGTTEAGGSANNGGTVFELAPPTTSGGAWTETVLYSFNGVWNEPHTPYGGVAIGPSGALDGTTYADWCWNCGPDGVGAETGGTAFMLAPPASAGGSWQQYTLHGFWPYIDALGMDPFAGLLLYGGSLYGTTYLYGFGGGCGAVYALSPLATGGAWTATAVHSFGGSDGCSPAAPLSKGPAGELYGTTFSGGTPGGCNQSGGCGVVFQLTPPQTPGGPWTETVIYNFTGMNGDGSVPWHGSVVVDGNGLLYGTTQCGGSSASAGFPCTTIGVTGYGVVFSLAPPAAPGGTWTEKILHTFTGGADGAVPVAGLTPGPNSVLYGTTSQGGSSGNGTVFSIQP